MTIQQWLAVAGAAAGSLGSIITAFSLNFVIRELNIARRGLEITVEVLANNQNGIPVFQGFDQRYDRAARLGNKLVWLGVFLLVAGFILQAVSVCMGS
jgi:hypothetical protein